LTFLAKLINIGSLQDVLALLGITGSPILGLFLLGYLFPFANSTGAIFGTITSLISLFFLFVGRFFANQGIRQKGKPFANLYCNATANRTQLNSDNKQEKTIRLVQDLYRVPCFGFFYR
jgi:hypothetical protein